MTKRALSSVPLWLICAGAILLVLARALAAWPEVPVRLQAGDNDDLMRLVTVRDWLAGQGWFDPHQYRLLPPEGVEMHWSRYVDAGIAAFLVPASWFLPMAQAEQAALVLWPVFLACLAILVIAPATDRLFGRAAALGALVMFLAWDKFGGEFVAARIDHHNVQLLCATAVFFLSVLPGRPVWRGAVAGAVTALSLAVGLEMLPFLALVWIMGAVRAAYAVPGARDWLVSFGTALVLAAPLLMAGQVPVSGWMVNHCDVLAPPVLVLALIGAVATIAPLPFWDRLTSPPARIGAMLVLAALGLALGWPVLESCAAGPYAAVPPEVRAIIDSRVTEARPVLDLLATDPATVLTVLLSPVLVALAAALACWRLWPELMQVQRLALVQALVVVAVGLAIAMTQIRAANLMVPAMPLLAGFAVRAWTRIPRASPLRGIAAILLLAILPMSVDFLILQWQRVAGGPPAATPLAAAATGGTGCRAPAAMAELAALPPGSVLFTSLNLGAAVLAYTPQSATSAPYHRRAEAFWNGVGAFADPEALRAAVLKSGADYLVLCRGAVEGESGEIDAFETAPDAALPGWLERAPGPQTHFAIFAIRKDLSGGGG